jgi:hypothetical protein
VNNVYAYDETGQDPTQPFRNVLSAPASVELPELRALHFSHNYLYVANGSKKVNNVLCFQESSGTSNPLFRYVGTFVAGTVNSLAHPFSICFGTRSHAYISSQDTNVVTQLNLANDFQTGAAVKGNAATYLHKFGKGFLDGTFVASHDAVPGFEGTPKVGDQEGGLDFALQGGSMSHSVRDVVICNGVLCVADEAGREVKIYDLGTGDFLAASAKLSSGPIHLLVQGSTFVRRGRQRGLRRIAERIGRTLALKALNLSPALPDEASGMCFDGSGSFYVAVRKQNEIYRYNSSFAKGAAFLTKLPDNPEFVVWQPAAS